ncbi:MAG: inositol monophosphatase [Oscillospiraceae bacterium]|nr:inositol monophosphatase [Oscillospiraceae bacterium]
MLEQIIEIVRRAGELVCSAHDIGAGVQEKTSHVDLVTIYDPMVQEQLRRELLGLLPEAGFLGEEEEVHDIEGKRAIFIVDPIDGTTNFVRGLHHSAISVGLMVDGVMEYAAVYNPYRDEMFSARRGSGAWCNGQPIHVTDKPLDRSIALVGTAIYYRETIPQTAQMLSALLPQVVDLRRSGSAALDCCYVAAGRVDLFFECLLCPWDYAAGSLIITEAGGMITALDGSPLRLTERCSVAAGNPANHPALVELGRSILK